MSSRGVTKIELLISISLALIIIIVDIVVISYLNDKARDIQVLAEVSQVRSSLEVFLLNNNHYPPKQEAVLLNDSNASTEKLCLSGFMRITEKCQKNILNPIPNIYLAEGNYYTYQSIDEDKNYKLEFNLTTNFKKQGILKGINCATNSQIVSQACF
jgi:Tfp pilus assembly protein PilE